MRCGLDERTAMPYFIYRIFESTKAENVAVCDHFHEALAVDGNCVNRPARRTSPK
jgi:hypothetical protein